jgi:hypothetical protein
VSFFGVGGAGTGGSLETRPLVWGTFFNASLLVGSYVSTKAHTIKATANPAHAAMTRTGRALLSKMRMACSCPILGEDGRVFTEIRQFQNAHCEIDRAQRGNDVATLK